MGRGTSTTKQEKISIRIGVTAPDDPRVADILAGYHRKGITDSRLLSKLLLDEHGIILGVGAINKRRKKLNLRASRSTTKELDEETKRQLVLEQIRKDPSGKIGAATVKARIFQEKGLHLSREYVREQMRLLDPSHASRGPRHVKLKRLLKMRDHEQGQGQGDKNDGPLNVSAYEADTQNSENVDDVDSDEEDTYANGGGSNAGCMDTDGFQNESSPLPTTSIVSPSAATAQNASYPHSLAISRDQQYAHGSILFPHQLPVTISPATNTSAISLISSSSTFSTLNPVAKSSIMKMLQDTTPKLQDLIKLINNHLLLEGALATPGQPSFTTEELDNILKGMESAALLERQLARLSSIASKR